MMLKKIRLLTITLLYCIISISYAEIDPAYISWLEEQSMLNNAAKLTEENLRGDIQNRTPHPFATPQPEKILKTASVWFSAYPSAIITPEGETILSTLADEELWKIFHDIGVQAIHTGPMKLSGSLEGYQHHPTEDGWFDRISLTIDPAFGEDQEYKKLVKNAAKYHAIVIGDIIPGHTGRGADFTLATLNYKDFPGIYSMMEIKPEDWRYLPQVPEGSKSANLSFEAVEILSEKGYLPGRLERVLFTVPGKPQVSGWDATPPIVGIDGIERRWVYLHYFKPNQPTLNWIDPTFAANRLIVGDIIKTRMVYGAKVFRLDANPFLGIEVQPGRYQAWSEGHPLSIIASNNIAMIARRLDGWTFQELNMGFEEIKDFSRNGADLSYDFITRPSYNHALLTGDAEFLRMTLRLMHDYRIDPKQLIHALQNHDEITYELVHFDKHRADDFVYKNKLLPGQKLREMIVQEMHSLAINPKTPYNKLSGNGLCTTFTGLCATALNIEDIYNLTEDETKTITKMHLLMAIYNAMQPGAFIVSGWDLVGALPLTTESVTDFIGDGDYRWINRGSYDLLGHAPEAKASPHKIPKAFALYGSLPQQLQDPQSFASQLKHIIDVRNSLELAFANQISIPEVKNMGTVMMVHRLTNNIDIEVTALNFGRETAYENLQVDEMQNVNVIEMLSNTHEGITSPQGTITIKLEPYEGKVLLLSSKG
ncbi:MAG: maltose alpha-D-glucosyltransferase [Chlamydiota bacterium]